MKKIVTSLITTVGILGSTILFTGCVQLPPVPDAMKVSTYTTGSSNDRYTNVANLTGDEKLSCEYKYCTARMEDSSFDKLCKPSRDRLASMTKQYTNFNDKQRVISNFIELCPHSNIIDSPFN
ncbi:MAG: hypothetical protein KTQ14_06565 [Fusobacteriaceae bacterium]|jgi:hypothetical protein|nr:hypothetical protein [Fusobacteriaceae bacterium]